MIKAEKLTKFQNFTRYFARKIIFPECFFGGGAVSPAHPRLCLYDHYDQWSIKLRLKLIIVHNL